MSIFSRFKKGKIDDKLGRGSSFLFGMTPSGAMVNEESAMQTAAVYACVKVLSETMAELPLNLYKLNENGGRSIAYNHPLRFVLHEEPNPEMTSYTFRETLMGHLLLWGNAYAQIVRNKRGDTMALYPLAPDRMAVSRDKSGKIIYTYDRESDDLRRGEKEGQLNLRADEVLHIPGMGFDGLIGYSPVAMAKNAIGLAIVAERYGADFFKNQAYPGGIIETEKTVNNSDKLKESWNMQFGSGGRPGSVAVLEEGLKFHPLSVNARDSQFLETRKFQLNEIARIFGVPPHMIGDLEKSSFSNIEQQSIEFVKYTIGPWMSRWEQALKRALLLPSEKAEYFIKFNVDALLRGDYSSRMTGYAQGRQNGWMSANDIRRLEDMNEIPTDQGGDLYLVNGNMKTMSEIDLT